MSNSKAIYYDYNLILLFKLIRTQSHSHQTQNRIHRRSPSSNLATASIERAHPQIIHNYKLHEHIFIYLFTLYRQAVRRNAKYGTGTRSIFSIEQIFQMRITRIDFILLVIIIVCFFRFVRISIACRVRTMRFCSDYYCCCQ